VTYAASKAHPNKLLPEDGQLGRIILLDEVGVNVCVVMSVVKNFKVKNRNLPEMEYVIDT